MVAETAPRKGYEIAKKLLELGADPKVPNIKGEIPEQLAITIPIKQLLKNKRLEKGDLVESLRPKLSDYVLALKQIENGKDLTGIDKKKNNLILLAIKCGVKEKKSEKEVLNMLKALIKKMLMSIM